MEVIMKLPYEPYEFELNEDEKQQIESIRREFEAKFFYTGKLIPFPLNEEERCTMEEYNEKVRAIKDKARERTLEHYRLNPNELFPALKRQAQIHAVFVAWDEQQDKKPTEEFIVDLWKTSFEDYITPYLELLKNIAPKKHNEIISFIDYAFEHRREFLQQEQDREEIKTKPAVRTRTRRADNFILDRTKVNQAIREGREELYDGKSLLVKTGHTRSKNSPKTIYTPVALKYIFDELGNQGLSVKVIGRLEPFDMILAMHLDSLFYAGNNKVTYDMIATQMAGGRRTQASPKLRELIKQSLIRLRHYDIEINTEAEYKAGFNKQILFSGVMLPNKIVSEPAMFNGKRIEEYIYIYDQSVMSKYADSKDQVSRPLIVMFDVPLSLTKDNIELTYYLLDRIVDMQSPASRKNKYIIRYDTIFDSIGIEDKDNAIPVKKMRIRENVRKILKEWERKGFIRNFEELDENNKPAKKHVHIVKIKITLPPKQEEIKALSEKSV